MAHMLPTLRSRNQMQQTLEKSVNGGRQPVEPRFADTFPCEYPANPHFKNTKARLETYKTWNQNLDASIQELADAGFFYLGERDRCKCFYCNGGLQNWEKNDDPWYEHAKWFPNCEHVLQHKGFEYVEKINEKYPNLRRPVIHSPPGQDYPEMLGPSLGQQQISPPSPSNHINSMEMECESSSDEEKMEDDYDPTVQEELIEQIKGFGFKDEVIFEVVRKKQQSGSGFQSLMELLEAVQEKESESEEENDLELPQRDFQETQVSRQVTADSTCHVPAITTKPVASDPRNDQMTRKNDLISALDEVRCVICKVNDRNCLLTSCGHLATCYDCGKKSAHCPICQMSISGNIHKIYKI